MRFLCYKVCNMKRVILRTKPIHLIVFSVIGISLFVFMFFIPSIWKWSENDLILEILWYVISTMGILFCLYQLLSHLEFAIIQNNTLIIKKYIFITLVELPLEKLQYVFIERLPAQPNPGSPFVNWITLCLDDKEKLQGRKYGGINRKRQSPWQVIATPKNLEILSQFLVIDDPWNLL